MTNIWRQNPDILINPYHVTALKAAGVTRDMSPAEIDHAIQSRLRILKRMGQGFLKFQTRGLDEADLAGARHILLDNPARRLLEELLEHQPEALPDERLAHLQSRLDQLVPAGLPRDFDPHEFMLRCVRAVLAHQLELLAADVPPFPVDTRLVPPSGLSERDSDG